MTIIDRSGKVVTAPKGTAIKPTGAMIAGLPTYTPAQLHLVNPAAKYKAYINYVNTRRGNRQGPAWPGRGGPGLPTIESLIRNVQIDSPAAIQARMTQMTNDQVKAQQGLVNDEAVRARAQALRTMQAQAAAGNAAAAMNKDLFGMVGGQYNAGAQALSSLATGGVSDVTDRTAADTAATNASLAAVGMPGIDPRMAGPEQAAVARYRAGLGAQDMTTQGQAANFGLAGLINSQNLRATQEAVAGQNVSNTAIEQKQSDAIAEIARTRPDVAAKILAQLQDANRQQIALGSSLLQQRRAALQTGFQQGMTKKNYALSVKQLAQQKAISDAQIKAASAKLANQNAMPDSDLSGKLGYLVDSNGNALLNKAGQPVMLPGFKVGKDGKVVNTNKRTQGVATAGEIQSFLGGLKKTDFVTQTVRDSAKGTSQSRRVPSGESFVMPFKQAYNRLMSWGGLDDATARQYLQSVYQRGQGGRDWLTNEEQTVLSHLKTTGALPAGVAGPPHAMKLNTHARTIKDPQTGVVHGYLTQVQKQALEQSGHLPSGTAGLVKGEPVWYISPGG